ncbi:MAG: radical SAM protein [Anaerolineae bacterium]
MIVEEIRCKSILTKSGIAGVDYAINPYVGCQHGCVYCYAVFMKRFTGHREEWGHFVDVRVNAAEVLARQLKRARAGSIMLSSVTDAYQPLERKYGISRACLEVLCHHPAFTVSILTKSDLVLRDLDILHQLQQVEVAFTITTLDDEIRRRFEPKAPPVSTRLDALAQLAEAGIATWAFYGPALPYLSDSEERMEALFQELKQVGVSYILVDSMNLRGAMWGRVRACLEEYYPELVDDYQLLSIDRRGYSRMLAQRARRIADRLGLVCEVEC